MASSLVGANIKALICLFPFVLTGSFEIPCNIGMAKAAVFHVPV